MNESYNRTNIKLLSFLSYLGPLFLIGVFSMEHDTEELRFHTRQGGVLFFFMVFAYLLVWLLTFLLRSVPAMAEIMGVLLKVGLSVGWLLMAVMGIVSVFQKDHKPLPFLWRISRLFRKKQG